MQERESEKEAGITLQDLNRFQKQLSELYETNINLRMKYPTEPLKFYQSQQEIDNILKQLQEVTQQNIADIVESKILVPILKILNHPNSDINMSCIQFLHEIISEEPSDDQLYQIYYRMNIWMVENGLFQSLTETINKLDEQTSVDEYEISLKILKIIETLTDLWDQSLQSLANETKILDYLANRIMPNYVVQHKVLDDNKFVSSDILVLILSHSAKAQQKFHRLFGMQILLESIRPYLTKAAACNDEQEYVSNLFDCLNIMLINPTKQLGQSRRIYHQMKGNQIMLMFLKAKNMYSVLALKAIANSFTLAESQSQSHMLEQLIQSGALKYVFPIIVRQGLKGEDIDEQRAIDESCLQIVLLLIRGTTEIYRMRVESKLTEKRFEKLQKIFQIRSEYMQSMGRQIDKQISSQQYLERLKEGLTIVEIIDKILATLIVSTSTVKQKIITLMKLYGVRPHDIQLTFKNAYQFIGENPEKQYLQKLLSNNTRILYELFESNKTS